MQMQWNLLYPTFKRNIATEWGNHKELETLGAYLALKQQKWLTHNHCPKKWICCSSITHWLGASPDGLVNDPTSNDPEGIVEFKNPYAIRNMNLMETITQNKDICLALKNGSLHLVAMDWLGLPSYWLCHLFFVLDDVITTIDCMTAKMIIRMLLHNSPSSEWSERKWCAQIIWKK